MAVALAVNNPPAPLARGVNVLFDMLTYKRPAWGEGEAQFIDKFIRPLDPHMDDFGNLWVEVGDSPHILWSSHTDTVHHTDGRQLVEYKDDLATAVFNDAVMGKSNCLGADCAAGVWLMREMILSGVPGLYVFHRDEEAGGRGSSWVAFEHPEYVADIKFAIAFDRKGYTSVITHQGGRTASDAFARSLADILGGAFEPDPTGLFTDTAFYTDLVGECSNVSVGYHAAHGPTESLNVPFLLNLLDTIVAADFSGLVAERKPGDEDEGYGAAAPTDWFSDGYESQFDRAKPSHSERTSDRRFQALLRFVKDNPDLIADYLDSSGECQWSLEEWGERWGYRT